MGKTATVQKLSVAVGTHSQHSAEGLAAVLDAAKELTIAVVGDVLLDEYLHGGAARVAREAPVPAVTEPGRRTVVKRRLVAEGQLLARFDEGDRTLPNARSLREAARSVARVARHA